MSELHCSGPCGLDKDENEFPWRNRIAGVKHRVCNACAAAAAKRHYENNAPKYLTRARERRAETRSLLDHYTSTTGCTSCGEADPVCLVLDPVSNAAASPSALVAGGSWSSIEPQLSNYAVRCLNCRAKTHRNGHTSQED